MKKITTFVVGLLLALVSADALAKNNNNKKKNNNNKNRNTIAKRLKDTKLEIATTKKRIALVKAGEGRQWSIDGTTTALEKRVASLETLLVNLQKEAKGNNNNKNKNNKKKK